MTERNTSSSKSKTVQLVQVAMFAALMMIGANISAYLIIGGVPITLQTFFAILAGMLLGKRNGALAMTVYMALGLVGLPVFAGFSGGFDTILSPTFGFILSFIGTAWLVGFISEKMPTRVGFIVAAIIGLVFNYLVGTNWMYAAYKFWFEAPPAFSYGVAWAWMIAPFIKDIILAVLAGIFGYRLKGILK